MGWMRRIAPALLVGFGLLALGQQALIAWQNRPAPAPVVDGIVPIAGAGCLSRDAVLTALGQRGIRAHPEVPAFCHAPADLPDWYALDPVGPDGTHLAFDAAGCLAVWTPAPCPAP